MSPSRGSQRLTAVRHREHHASADGDAGAGATAERSVRPCSRSLRRRPSGSALLAKMRRRCVRPTNRNCRALSSQKPTQIRAWQQNGNARRRVAVDWTPARPGLAVAPRLPLRAAAPRFGPSSLTISRRAPARRARVPGGDGRRCRRKRGWSSRSLSEPRQSTLARRRVGQNGPTRLKMSPSK
jgi:hypothetical protein